MIASSAKPHVAVVGAGIIGSAMAWALARNGAAVTVVDESNPANRATRGSFAWINAHYPDERHYFNLRLESMRLWREAAEAIPDLPVRFGGTLNWEDPPDRIEDVARTLDDMGNSSRVVSGREITEMEPALAAPPELAIDTPMEGVADPGAVAEAFLSAAEAQGAALRRDTRVIGLATASGRAIGLDTSTGRIDADHVVLAAGNATPDLLATLDVTLPMDIQPGLLMRSQPVARVSRRVLTSFDLHVWQMQDGRLLVGEDFGGTDPSEGVDVIEARVLEKLRTRFTGIETPRIETTTVTNRPKPADGYPALGAIPGLDNLTVAVMHSGVTLAPAVGEYLAREILDGAEAPELTPYRLARFA